VFEDARNVLKLKFAIDMLNDGSLKNLIITPKPGGMLQLTMWFSDVPPTEEISRHGAVLSVKNTKNNLWVVRVMVQ